MDVGKYFHATGAMLYVLHAVFSIVIGALVSGLVYVGSNAFTGSVDNKAVLLSGLSTVAIYFTTHITALSNSPQLAQAESDGLGEVKASVEALTVSHNSLLAFLTQAPPVSAPAPQLPPAQSQFVQPGGAVPAVPQFSYAATSTYPLPAITK